MTVLNLPVGRQTFDHDCGAKAVQVVMAYYGLDVREDDLMEQLECDSNGTPVKHMIFVAEKNGFQVIAENGVTLETVRQYIDQGHPVLVLIQAWANKEMNLDDWREDWDDGHYAIVIGYQDNIIVFQDPASFRRKWMSEEEFLVRWHDTDPRTNERYENFGMVLLGKEPCPKTLEHMD